MADLIFLALLFIHVATVALWMGASILLVSVLRPSLAKLSASSRFDFLKVIGPVYERYVITNGSIAVISGLLLYAYITQVSPGLAPSSSGTPSILAGIIFGLAAFIIGIAVIPRANHRLLRLISQGTTEQPSTGAPSSESQAVLQRRIAASAGLQALLLVLALLSMVVGANL